MMKAYFGFENITRTALVLKRKQPFYDWLKRIENGIDFTMFEDDSDVYLLPDFETTEEMDVWLKLNFDKLFCDQMNNWNLDERLWEKNRTFKKFNDWFEYSKHTMIWDTVDDFIEKI